ncbi:MAG: hypothetical protein PHX18_07205 [Candidatus Gastranaerophilales bacterium]|nr:hypothetical protein [Candidatus Gastranaerophilales bacterium]
MGGNSTPDVPEYKFVPTYIQQDGQTLASNYYDPVLQAYVTNVATSAEDQARKSYLKNQLSEYEKGINTFSPELVNQWENIANAQKQSAVGYFDSMYEPAARSAREDYFARLGTLDSTAYLDRQNDIEKTRQQAYADIANNYVANMDTLKQNELSNRYNYLNYLQNGINGAGNTQNNYLSAISALGSSYNNSYNDYLWSKYKAELAGSSATSPNIASLVSSAGGAVLGTATANPLLAGSSMAGLLASF